MFTHGPLTTAEVILKMFLETFDWLAELFSFRPSSPLLSIFRVFVVADGCWWCGVWSLLWYECSLWVSGQAPGESSVDRCSFRGLNLLLVSCDRIAMLVRLHALREDVCVREEVRKQQHVLCVFQLCTLSVSSSLFRFALRPLALQACDVLRCRFHTLELLSLPDFPVT